MMPDRAATLFTGLCPEKPLHATCSALEVNLDPPNEASLAFHRARGYSEVGQLGPTGHTVSLMVRSSADVSPANGRGTT